MANNGIYYSSGNSLNFTTNNTTWATLTSGGTFQMSAVSATTYYNLPPATFTGGTVSGETTFTSGLTVNYIDFDTTPNVPAPTGGTVYFDSNENALSYKPITPSNDVTVNLGQESLIRFYNNLGFQINNGQALHITGATSGTPTVSLAVGTGGDAVQFQVSGIATHDVPDSTYGFMTSFGVVRDINLTAFTVGQQIYLSQTTPGGFDSYSNLSFTGRTCEIGHVLDNSSSGKLQVTILNEIEGTIITTQENNILAANNSSTGVFQFSGLSIDTPSGTTFSVGAVEGWIIDNVTSPANPTIQLIIYPGSSGNTSLYYSSDTETYILLTSGQTLIQQTTFPTPQQRRQNLYLGKFGHGNKQFLINAFNEPDSSLSPLSQLRDMFTAVKLVNDGVIASANGANLNINTSAGILYGLGIGYVTNKLNPNTLTISGQSPATFQYRTQTGGTATNTTTIEPGFWDVNGVRTAISGVKATNQRIYLLQNGQIRIQYGQTEYNQLAAAISALQNETFVTFPNFRDNGILIGVLAVLSTATNLSDTSKAQFFSVSKFGELIGAAGGTSTTTLQQAYNNSSEPEIIINSTLDGITIKNGTGNADNITPLIQGQNSGGTVTSFIRADGAFSGTSISATTLTSSTATITGQFNSNSGVRFSGLSSVAGSRILVSDGSGNVAYREDIVKGSGGTTNYVTKWTNTEQIVDSNIYADGNFVGIGTNTQVYQEGLSIPGDGGIASNSFIFVGHSSGSIAIADANYKTWSTNGNEIAIGTGSPLLLSVGSGNIAIGPSSLQVNTSGSDNVAIGFAPLTNNQAGQGNVAIGYNAGANVTSGSFNVIIGYSAGSNVTTEDNRLYIANETYGTLIYGEFDNQILNVNGTLSATTYDNLPGSSSANCFTTFYVTNISGCSPVNVLSPLNVKDGINVTGTSTFTSQVNFTGGLSANTFSASTYQNLPTDVFVSAGTYSNGQITFTNTTGGTFNVSNIPIGGAGGQPYYLNLSVSQTPYREFSPSATTAAEQTTGVTIASGVTTTIANFLTPTGYPNATLIPAGIWSFYLHSYKANSSTTFDIFVEVYKRTTGGTETLLVSTDPTDVNSIGVASMEISDTYYSGSSLNVSDRILIKVRATNTGTASSTITFLTEGTDHYSYGVTPFTNTGNVLGVTATDGISGSSTTGSITLINTDKGSSQNIFKNIQVAGVTQFSAGSNSSNLNFSGINITITSAATNTLVFSAGTGGVSGDFLPTSGGTIEGNLIVTGNTNVSGVTTSTGNVISLQNLQSLYSVGDEGGEITLAKPATNSTISGTSVTIDIYQNKLRFFESGSPNRGAYIDLTQGLPSAGSNLLSGGTGGGVTQIVAGTNITISPTGGTGTVTINSTGGLGTVYTTANNFNFL